MHMHQSSEEKQDGFCIAGEDPEEGKCEDNSDCVNGQEECYKSKCTKTCDVSKEKNVCDKDQYCHIDHGMCHNFCKSNKDCSEGYTCYNDQCYKDCPDGTNDCGRNQYCFDK